MSVRGLPAIGMWRWAGRLVMIGVLAVVLGAAARDARAQTTTSSTTTTTRTTTTTGTTTTTTTLPAALRCEMNVARRFGLLARALGRCTTRAASRSFAGKRFDESACAARAARRYDRALRRVQAPR